MGPTQPHSELVHAEKYRGPGESFSQAMYRISSALCDDAEHWDRLEDILSKMRFMPAGRIQAAIGSPKNITPYNCFVSGTFHDSFVHGDEHGQNSIMDIATQAAATMRMGGGIGYDWSPLRPSGTVIEGVKGTTDGPLAFMEINDAVCRATSSAGNRRGAQMGVLRVDHPDVRKYIRAKQPTPLQQALWDHIEALPGDHPRRTELVLALQETLKLTGFNLSLGITDKFMHALAHGLPFALEWGGKVYELIDPAELWEEIMRSTWDWAEPGVLFIDTINKQNNLWYCETIAATNPCGEQPLPPHGACLLGSFNLTKYITPGQPYRDGGAPRNRWVFDMTQFRADIPAVVLAMDKVVDIATYPLAQQEGEAKSKRRMGLGITGLANAAEACGFAYGSEAFLQFERSILAELQYHAYDASVEVAMNKGAFPLFDERYLKGQHIQRLEPELRKAIAKHGIRNSHLTSIAPTGTISYVADNISSSIEPVFMYEGYRKMKTLEGEVTVEVLDYGVREFGVRGKLAADVSAEEHVDVLATAAGFVDSAVSKTCNVSPNMPWESFKDLYRSAYERGCKGITTFNPGGKRLGIFTPKEPDPAPDACSFDPATGRRSCE